MEIVELLLLALSLAMDAFAVSVGKGLSMEKVRGRDGILCGLWFGIFQALMPLLGYLLGTSFDSYVERFAPWIAFVLLMIIGLNMIREAYSSKDKDGQGDTKLDAKTMLLLAIATSIDAFVVGITFSFVPIDIVKASEIVNVVLGVAIIGAITFILSLVGMLIGGKFGAKYRKGAEIVGGIILMLLAIKILLEQYIVLN